MSSWLSSVAGGVFLPFSTTSIFVAPPSVYGRCTVTYAIPFSVAFSIDTADIGWTILDPETLEAT